MLWYFAFKFLLVVYCEIFGSFVVLSLEGVNYIFFVLLQLVIFLY
jgi:hypothetical protein